MSALRGAAGGQAMNKIYVVLVRHEKKEARIPKPEPGGLEDRTQVPLSADGRVDASASGRRELYDKGVRVAHIVHSGFLRTAQTAEAWLRGAGITEDPYANADLFRIIADSEIGLSGAKWDYPCFPPFGNDQEVLNTYVRHALGSHYLRSDEPPQHTGVVPVMARKAAAVLEHVVSGVEDVARRLQSGENGAVIVVTHGPIVDAATMTLNGGLKVVQLQDYVNRIELKPFVAHREGEYVVGTLDLGGDPNEAWLALNIRGTEHARSMDFVKRLAAQTNMLAHGSFQHHEN